MTNSRRTRPAADVTVGYATDERGRGVAFAAINTGTAVRIVRLAFEAAPLPALEGLENGYAAMGAVGAHLKSRGFGRVRIRVADPRVVADLTGTGAPPKALTMSYVKTSCTLHALGPVRLEAAESIEIRDLTARAQAEVGLHAAA
ncbi:MAG: hypothetical protein ABSB70_10105 [Candidatus Velthaea sp.]|jgi:hypothetical protein